MLKIQKKDVKNLVKAGVVIKADTHPEEPVRVIGIGRSIVNAKDVNVVLLYGDSGKLYGVYDNMGMIMSYTMGGDSYE